MEFIQQIKVAKGTSFSFLEFSSDVSLGGLGEEDRPDRAEVAAEEDEDNAIHAVQATDLNQRLEGLRDLDSNALHLADALHALHEVGQV